MISLDLRNAKLGEDLSLWQDKVSVAHKQLHEKTGKGNDFLGWVDWPINYDKGELLRIKKDAQYVRDNFEVLVVCGIGGSYLGAKSAIDALKGLKPNDKLEIIFMGQTFSPNYVAQVMEYLKEKKGENNESEAVEWQGSGRARPEPRGNVHGVVWRDGPHAGSRGGVSR